jgi:hypothetical protein
VIAASRLFGEHHPLLEGDSMNVVSSGRHPAAGDAAHCPPIINSQWRRPSPWSKDGDLAGPAVPNPATCDFFPKLLLQMDMK